MWSQQFLVGVLREWEILVKIFPEKNLNADGCNWILTWSRAWRVSASSQVCLPVVNAGYRCPRHNQAVGGVPNSEHPRGLAAVIRLPGPSLQQMHELATQVAQFAEGDIAVYDGDFLHVDVRGHRARWARGRPQRWDRTAGAGARTAGGEGQRARCRMKGIAGASGGGEKGPTPRCSFRSQRSLRGRVRRTTRSPDTGSESRATADPRGAWPLPPRR